MKKYKVFSLYYSHQNRFLWFILSIYNLCLRCESLSIWQDWENHEGFFGLLFLYLLIDVTSSSSYNVKEFEVITILIRSFTCLFIHVSYLLLRYILGVKRYMPKSLFSELFFFLILSLDVWRTMVVNIVSIILEALKNTCLISSALQHIANSLLYSSLVVVWCKCWKYFVYDMCLLDHI